MAKARDAWGGDWRAKIDESLRARGHSLLLNFLNTRPGVPYRALCEELGDFAPIQLVARSYEEARRYRRLSEALADGLHRCVVEQFPVGWSNGSETSSKRLLAVTGWQSEAMGTGGLEHLGEQLSAIVQLLLHTSPPPDGWFPADSNDPLIRECIRVGFGAQGG